MPADPDTNPLEAPKRVILSDHIKALLEVSENRPAMVETIFEATHPSSWSGSLATILETRSRAFAELLDYPDHGVQSLVRRKINDLGGRIRDIQIREAKEHNEREQRFES